MQAVKFRQAAPVAAVERLLIHQTESPKLPKNKDFCKITPRLGRKGKKIMLVKLYKTVLTRQAQAEIVNRCSENLF